MAIATSAPASSSPSAEVAILAGERRASDGGLHELLLRYAESSVPLSLRLFPNEEWEAPASSGLWTRLRYWAKRLAWGDLDSDE